MSANELSARIELSLAAMTLTIDQVLPLTGVTAVFGPSGSGKSTLLRCIAGFARPDSGRITVGDEIWFDANAGINLPPHQRAAGLMFQDARLFEHHNVAGNLALAERFSRHRDTPGGKAFQREQVLQVLELTPLLGRRPAALSGGEQRRVALARTLLARPALLLLDEPLTGLDAQRKADILPYLERVLQAFGLPTLYVSHDIAEVAQLADRVLVLNQGRVQVTGPTAEVLERFELNAFTGDFEAGVVVTGQVVQHDVGRHLTQVDLEGERLSMPIQVHLAVGATVRLRIRARDVALATHKPQGLSIRNVLPGQLLQLNAEPQPGFVDALVQVASSRIRARLTQAAVEDLQLAPGESVYVLIKSASFAGQA